MKLSITIGSAAHQFSCSWPSFRVTECFTPFMRTSASSPPFLITVDRASRTFMPLRLRTLTETCASRQTHAKGRQARHPQLRQLPRRTSITIATLTLMRLLGRISSPTSKSQPSPVRLCYHGFPNHVWNGCGTPCSIFCNRRRQPDQRGCGHAPSSITSHLYDFMFRLR